MAFQLEVVPGPMALNDGFDPMAFHDAVELGPTALDFGFEPMAFQVDVEFGPMALPLGLEPIAFHDEVELGLTDFKAGFDFEPGFDFEVGGTIVGLMPEPDPFNVDSSGISLKSMGATSSFSNESDSAAFDGASYPPAFSDDCEPLPEVDTIVLARQKWQIFAVRMIISPHSEHGRRCPTFLMADPSRFTMVLLLYLIAPAFDGKSVAETIILAYSSSILS